MRFVVKRAAGLIDVFDLKAGAAMDRAKALIMKHDVPLEQCIYFEDICLADDSFLSDHVFDLGRGDAEVPRRNSRRISARLSDTDGFVTEGTATDTDTRGSDGDKDQPRPTVARPPAGRGAAGRGAAGRGAAGRAGAHAQPPRGPVWEVVGGEAYGGILVRQDESKCSLQKSERLSHGSRVEQLELKGERLRYRRLAGSGPSTGWISTATRGKTLAKQLPPAGPPALALAAESARPVALVFACEGAQHRRMLGSSHRMPVVRNMLQKARDILDYDVLDLILNAPEVILARTRFCQPALFLTQLVAFEELKSRRPDVVARVRVAAGIGLGHYTALCVAGFMSFEDGLRILKLRGEAMEDAFPIGHQIMLVCVGLEVSTIQTLCVKAAREEGPRAVCEIAHYDFPGACAICGTEKAILCFEELAREAGAFMLRKANTAVASECSLMQPAWERLSVALKEALPYLKSPHHTVWSTTARGPIRPGSKVEGIIDDLKLHLSGAAHWENASIGILRDGIRAFYELGPGRILSSNLSRMDKRLVPHIHNINGRNRWRELAPCVKH